MNAVNGYILYQIIRDKNEKPRRHSIMPMLTETTQHLRGSRLKSEPFCQPLAPHIPIRERLSSRARCSSVGGSNDQDLEFVSNLYSNGRRHRRMTLLQSLRYQNKQLADSGFELVAEEKSNKDAESITELPIKSNDDTLSSLQAREAATKSNSLSINRIKAKAHAFFGKKNRKKRQSVTSGEASSKECASDTEHARYTSIDYSSKESRQRKSPSTNDSGRGSQGRLGNDEEQLSDSHEAHKVGKTIAVVENIETEKRSSFSFGTNSILRSVSCPELEFRLPKCDSTLEERMLSAGSNKQLDSDSDEEFTSSSDNYQQNCCNPCAQSPIQSEKSVEAVGIAEHSDVRFAKRMMRPADIPYGSCNSSKKNAVVYGNDQDTDNLGNEASSTWERCTMESFLSSLPPLPPPMPSLLLPLVNETNFPHKPLDHSEADDGTSIETSLLMEKMTLGGNEEDFGSYRCDDDTDNDANTSSIMLDQYLPCLSELLSSKKCQTQSAASSHATSCSDTDKLISESNEKVGGVAQTELSLVRISDQLNAYLNGLGLASAIEQKTINPELGKDSVSDDIENFKFEQYCKLLP
uniref:PDZ domain-containing protein 2 n=1 Tax=Syphacia muris TaxID=451379 RepID=A0A0N5A829_9BILA